MPPEETKSADTTPPVREAPIPVSESPAPEPVQIIPEPNPVPVETVPTPLEAPVEVQTAQESASTAQIPPNEPIAPKPEPIPEPVQQPQPSAPTSVIAPALNLLRDLAVKARAVIQSRKRKKLEKIMEVVNAKGKITNDQVEKLLHVSDATATRYLAQLEKEGKVKQEGKTGKGVSYLKI